MNDPIERATVRAAWYRCRACASCHVRPSSCAWLPIAADA